MLYNDHMDKATHKKIAKNINETSFYFFLTLSIIHIISGLLVVNKIYLRPAWLINRLLDTPFFIVSFIYIASLIKLSLLKKENYSHSFEIYSAIIGGILLLTILIFDLTFDNQLPTL